MQGATVESILVRVRSKLARMIPIIREALIAQGGGNGKKFSVVFNDRNAERIERMARRLKTQPD